MKKPVNIVDKAMEIARSVRRVPKKSAKKKAKKPALVVMDMVQDVEQDIPIANALRLARGGGGGADSGQAANRTSPSRGGGGGGAADSGQVGGGKSGSGVGGSNAGSRAGGSGGAGDSGRVGGGQSGSSAGSRGVQPSAGGGGGGGGGGGADSGRAAKQAEATKAAQTKTSVSPAAREPAGYSRPAGYGAAPSGVYGPRMVGDVVSNAPSTFSTENAMKKIAEGSSIVGGYPESKIQDRVAAPVAAPVKLEQTPTISRNAYDAYRPSAADNVYIGADFKPSGPSADSGYSPSLTRSLVDNTAAPVGMPVSSPSYDPLSSVRTPAPVAQASYNPLSSVSTPVPPSYPAYASGPPSGFMTPEQQRLDRQNTMYSPNALGDLYKNMNVYNISDMDKKIAAQQQLLGQTIGASQYGGNVTANINNNLAGTGTINPFSAGVATHWTGGMEPVENISGYGYAATIDNEGNINYTRPFNAAGEMQQTQHMKGLNDQYIGISSQGVQPNEQQLRAASVMGQNWFNPQATVTTHGYEAGTRVLSGERNLPPKNIRQEAEGAALAGAFSGSPNDTAVRWSPAQISPIASPATNTTAIYSEPAYYSGQQLAAVKPRSVVVENNAQSPNIQAQNYGFVSPENTYGGNIQTASNLKTSVSPSQQEGGYFTPEQRAAYLSNLGDTRSSERPFPAETKKKPEEVIAQAPVEPYKPVVNPPYVYRDYLSESYGTPLPPPSTSIADFNAYNQRYMKRGGRIGGSLEAALRIAKSKLL